jgi:hypothetical protein
MKKYSTYYYYFYMFFYLCFFLQHPILDNKYWKTNTGKVGTCGYI